MMKRFPAVDWKWLEATFSKWYWQESNLPTHLFFSKFMNLTNQKNMFGSMDIDKATMLIRAQIVNLDLIKGQPTPKK